MELQTLFKLCRMMQALLLISLLVKGLFELSYFVCTCKFVTGKQTVEVCKLDLSLDECSDSVCECTRDSSVVAVFVLWFSGLLGFISVLLHGQSHCVVLLFFLVML